MKRIYFLFILLCMMIFLTGCKEEKVNTSYYVMEDVVQLPERKEAEGDLLVADKTVFKLFYPDETGQVMLTKEIEVDEINKTTIWGKILELGYLDETIRLINLTGEELDNEERLLIAEFSDKMIEELDRKDEAQRQIIFGCIVNTLLDAYDAKGVRIQVGSEIVEIKEVEAFLEQEQVKLPEGFYAKFTLTHEESFTEKVKFNNIEETVTYKKFFSKEGYSIFYESDVYLNGYNEAEGLAVFEKEDFSTSITIYLSENSKIDTVQILTEQEEFGVSEVSETIEMEVGAEGYLATAVIKRGGEKIYNYYVMEEQGQIYVIEVRMNEENSLEDAAHIAKMLESFRIW